MNFGVRFRWLFSQPNVSRKTINKCIKLIRKSTAPTHVQESIISSLLDYVEGNIKGSGRFTAEHVIALRVSFLAAFGIIPNIYIAREVLKMLGIPRPEVPEKWLAESLKKIEGS